MHEFGSATSGRGSRPLGRRIKLTFLITDLKVGGVPLHLYRLATQLPAEAFRIRVISLADVGPVGERLRDAGIEVLACGARSALDVAALGRLWRYLVADPPDVLHAMLFHANIAARLVGPLADVPARRIICEIQTVEIERRWHLPVDGITCRLCRYEVGNSPSVIEHLHRRAHIPRARLQCVWGSVDVRRIASAVPVDRATLGVPASVPLLVWTGRLDPIKGFEQMLAACAALKSEQAFRFAIVGGGPYRSAIEELVIRHGLQDEVLLLGQRSDVPNLLQTADLFVFGSRTEGLPNSLLEAMAAGLPIVATDVPGCRDLVTHMQTGFLVRAGYACAAQMAQAIVTLLRNPGLAGRLGSAAQARAIEHLSTDAWISAWQKRYMDMLSSRGRFPKWE